MSKVLKFYIIFGLPGAGKGVCAQALKERKGFLHLSLGEYLRRQVRDQTRMVPQYGEMIKSGLRLLPCEYVWPIIKTAILKAYQNKQNLVIDGFPRTLHQLKLLEEFKQRKNLNIRYFFFDVKPSLAVERLVTRETCTSCGHDFIQVSPLKGGECDICKGKLLKRETDNPETITKRIEFFYQTTHKVLEELMKQSHLLTIDTNMQLDSLVERFLSLENNL